MTSAAPISSAPKSDLLADAKLHRVHFVRQASAGQRILLQFGDPEPQSAVYLQASLKSLEQYPREALGDGIDVLAIENTANDQLGSSAELMNWVAEGAGLNLPLVITMHGAQIIWANSRGAIQAAPDRMELYLKVLVDFTYHEHELRKLECEITENWALLNADTPFAYGVLRADPDRFDEIGVRMKDTLSRRMRLARIRPHLYQPRPQSQPLANQLLDRLREKSHVDERYESVSSQLEVYDRIYELCSQKIHEYKLSRKSITLEAIIVVLLLAEVVLLIFGLLANAEG